MLKDKVVLITGGTGSFGHRCAEALLRNHAPHKLIIFSRDELKQFEMQRRFEAMGFHGVRFFIGDVRDRDRLHRAFDGVDVVVHAAALKQVPACEYNPIEAVKTNILGAANVIDAAIDQGVGRVIALSTDKAASPCNLYGATKLCSDKLFAAGNSYVGERDIRFSVVRYGNVVGSRGSVVPLFLEERKRGVLPITDPRMTRFWITLSQGVQFVIDSLQRMHGGELFVPRIPSMNILDLARVVGPECETKIIGIRPGEKIHEVMITEDDARSTLEFDDYYAVLPDINAAKRYRQRHGGRLCPDGYRYSSDNNDRWLSGDELRAMVDELGQDGD
jgi:UDP-N-acetylglucosamine 4,6-dehydratase